MMTSENDWPILTRYDQEHLRKIALPIGGIGTGTVSLGGRGDLRDWEVVNRPAKGFAPDRMFFALYARPEGGGGVTRCLEGPIEFADYEGGFGSPAHNHGLPRFQHASFEAAYPFGQVLLSDPDVPVTVRLQAFNPLIPGDSDRSGIPAAVLRYVVTNSSSETLSISVCGSVENFIGSDGTVNASKGGVNAFRQRDGLAGLFLKSGGVDPQAEQWGTLALATTAAEGVTYRTDWASLSWGDALLDFWDDFSADGKLEQRKSTSTNKPMGSLAVQLDLPAGETQAITFLLAWHFPNRMTWTPAAAAEGVICCDDNDCSHTNWVGNYYATQYHDAWDVAKYIATDLPSLESDTLAFVHAFCGSDLPDVVKEAALYNLSTLRSQTCFRTADGHFFGWEGCGDDAGCCHGSCTHVWNYEQATAFLFGDLSRSMREVEFLYTTDDEGRMAFRARLPLHPAKAGDGSIAAADGQMGCLMKLYRDWQLSGDDAWLHSLWPQARKALEFCWITGGWDADHDGIMEGCQHNTMDVEYFGPNPQMGGWYLGALRAVEEMAHYQGEDEFAGTCRALFEQGRTWMDENLFNGDYYEHEIRPISNAEDIAPGLRLGQGADNLADPELQLGSGCLIDQLVGQYMANVCGLGPLLNPDHVRATLQSLMRWNFQPSLWRHFNNMRTFAFGDEAAMLMATYPKDRRPVRPFPYFNEVMTGFEYTAAVHMLYEGMIEDGLTLIRAVRTRYDGRKRSPFDEAECGHHYARAMASWAAVLALTGFHYSAVNNTMRFSAASTPCHWFWSNGKAWGVCEQVPSESVTNVRLTVGHGMLTLKVLELKGIGSYSWPDLQRVETGESISCTIFSSREEPSV